MISYPENERKYLAEYLKSVMQTGSDCEALAEELISKYGSLCGAVQRGYSELERVVGANGAAGLKLLGWITSRRFTDEFKPGRAYTDNEIKDYLKWLYFCRDVECVYILFFDKKSRLISSSKLSEGTVNSSEITPRRALEEITKLKTRPTYAILAHNHPGGLATVSIADEYATMVMKHALDGVGVELRGHLIVVGNDIASIDMK